MLRALILAVVLTGTVALTARADDEKKPAKRERPKLTEEQKALRKEINGKYDTDKDGKLSPAERKGISAEDKAKLEKAGIGPRKKREKE